MSATCLIGVQEEPLFLDIRSGSNTSQDFCNFITMAIEMKYLTNGDYLIYDNAAVHFADDTRRELQAALDCAGVVSIPLPVYSPELNPIERCFGVVKHHLRYQLRSEDDLLENILDGDSQKLLSILSPRNMCPLDSGPGPHSPTFASTVLSPILLNRVVLAIK